MKELLMEMMRESHDAGFRAGLARMGSAWTSADEWTVRGSDYAESLIRKHAAALGIDARVIPTEPGLYWVEIETEKKQQKVMVKVYRTDALSSCGVVLRFAVVVPFINNSWTSCPLDDPRIVRYLGRVNPEPMPMNEKPG